MAESKARQSGCNYAAPVDATAKLIANLHEANHATDVMHNSTLRLRGIFGSSSFFGSAANIQQWASPFTAGVSWLSRPDYYYYYYY